MVGYNRETETCFQVKRTGGSLAIWLQPARREANLRTDDSRPSHNGRAMGLL